MNSSRSLDSLFQFFNQTLRISAEAEKELASLCQVRFYKKNEEIQSIGATCKTIYFVLSGIARIYYLKAGNEVTEYFAFENDLIVRAESLFTGNPSKKAIQALEDSSLVSIPSEALFSLFLQFPELERLFNKLVQKSYVETLNRLESIQFLSAEERYKKLISEKPELIQKIPLKHIASFLGITQVSLSRIRAQIR